MAKTTKKKTTKRKATRKTTKGAKTAGRNRASSAEPSAKGKTLVVVESPAKARTIQPQPST